LFCRCEKCPNVKEEHRLRVLQNRVLRKILEFKRDEVTGEYRRLHNEELNYLWRHKACVGERSGATRFWWGEVR
jgi:hypothetical protein